MAAEEPLAPGEPGEPLGIAGAGGSLPRIVAEAAAAAGWQPHILGVADGIDSDWSPYPSRPMAWGKLGDGLNWLQARGVRRLVLCGTVSVRPDFKSIIPSVRTLMMMPQIWRVMRGGDDSLLRSATRTFEARGFEVIGVQAIVPSLLAPEGLIAGHRPTTDEEAAISRGVAAASMLGALDIGQAIVASRDRVVALEGIEGTREMLHRVADLRKRGRIGKGERCVLVKCRKPDQDDRLDLPSIGPATVEEAAEAGLAGIAVSTGGSLVLGLENVRKAARESGIFVIGRRTLTNDGSA